MLYTEPGNLHHRIVSIDPGFAPNDLANDTIELRMSFGEKFPIFSIGIYPLFRDCIRKQIIK